MPLLERVPDSLVEDARADRCLPRAQPLRPETCDETGEHIACAAARESCVAAGDAVHAMLRHDAVGRSLEQDQPIVLQIVT